MMQRFPIHFDSWYAGLSTALLLPPKNAFIEVAEGMVRVQMGWAFRCRFPISAVAQALQTHQRPLSRGVHGFAGRWLVNGSGDKLLAIDLNPPQRGYVMGFPIRLRQLVISVEQPGALASALMSPA